MSCLVLPIRRHAFFEQAVFQGRVRDHLLERRCLTPQILGASVSLPRSPARAVSPARRFLPASRKSFDQR